MVDTLLVREGDIAFSDQMPAATPGEAPTDFDGTLRDLMAVEDTWLATVGTTVGRRAHASS